MSDDSDDNGERGPSGERGVDRWRGLAALARDMVESGATAIEEVHLATARRTFTILEAIEPLRAPSRVVHAIHDAGVSASYGAVRLVNRAVAVTVDTVLAAAGTQRR